MKSYLNPEIEIISVSVSNDIITTSTLSLGVDPDGLYVGDNWDW